MMQKVETGIPILHEIEILIIISVLKLSLNPHPNFMIQNHLVYNGTKKGSATSYDVALCFYVNWNIIKASRAHIIFAPFILGLTFFLIRLDSQ